MAKDQSFFPGTNCKVVKTSGLASSSFVAAGPAGFIVAGTGLTDDMSTMQFFYDRGERYCKVYGKMAPRCCCCTS